MAHLLSINVGLPRSGEVVLSNRRLPTCEYALISGAVQYRPEPMEQPAEGTVLICCSWPQGDIEIDL